jgi:hypothetical protein
MRAFFRYFLCLTFIGLRRLLYSSSEEEPYLLYVSSEVEDLLIADWLLMPSSNFHQRV